MKTLRMNELNQKSTPQLIAIIMALQKDVKEFKRLLMAVQGYKLGINQLKVHIEKVLERTEEIDSIEVGMVL